MVKGAVELSVMPVITLPRVAVKFFQGQKMSVIRHWLSSLPAFAVFADLGVVVNFYPEIKLLAQPCDIATDNHQGKLIFTDSQ